MPEKDFLSSLKPAAQVIRDHVEKGDTIRIITHNDADGIASGGVLSRTIARMGAPFRISCEKRLDENLLKRVSSERPPIVILSDFGSGYLGLLEEHLSELDVVVLDHHFPEDTDATNLTHVNPILNGIDGSRELAASGICYLLSKELDHRNVDLSPLGLVGALGDQQDKGDKRSLIGLNTLVERDAVEGELLEKRIDLIFYGYETRPLPKAIAYTTVPFIPGLSGREDRCMAFLREVGIETKKNGRWRALRDLEGDEKRELFSALSNQMVVEGYDSDAVHNLVGTIYTFTEEEPWTPLRDGREYSSLLNACGRMTRSGLGLSIVLGDRGSAVEEVDETVSEYRRKIASALDWVTDSGSIKEMENVYFLRAGDKVEDTVIGVVSSILLSQGLLRRGKPIISTAYSDEELIKVSGRSTDYLASKGLHLGRVMQEAAELSDGGGGGHDTAAGAYIPIVREMDFIDRVDKLVLNYI